MYIRLLEQGFTTFSGHLGEVEFENGVSVESLSRSQIDRIASSIRTESFEGEAVGSANDLLDRSHEAPVVAPLATLEEELIAADAAKTESELKELAELAAQEPLQTGEPSSIADDSGAPAEVAEAPEASPGMIIFAKPIHTVESLGIVADTEGIQGLRDIAETFNVKGNSIAKLIEGILTAQGYEAP
jgi:hypothetical protein